MANYTIGDMVYDARIERGYSQEELGFGICSVSSVSRIENNLQVPAKRIYDALMQRLGVSESVYSAYISREEMELYRLMRKMISAISLFDFEELEELIKEVEKKIGNEQGLDRQYVLFAKANLSYHREKDLETTLALLLESIRITIPDFDERKPLKRRLLTFDEIEILCMFAACVYGNGKQWDGLRIFWDLKDYLEEHIIDEEEKAKFYPMILYNITLRIGSDFQRYKDVVELCDLGIDCCVKYNKLLMLPYLLNNKAFAVAELGDLEKAEGFFYQVIAFLKICKLDDFVKVVENDIKEKYNIVFS